MILNDHDYAAFYFHFRIMHVTVLFFFPINKTSELLLRDRFNGTTWLWLAMSLDVICTLHKKK